MKHIIALTICTIFTNIHTMDEPNQLWGTTSDSKRILLSDKDMQYSNLLSVLKEKNPDTPLEIPVTQKSFEFLRSTYDAEIKTLQENLTAEKYYELMDSAEKLKSPCMYAKFVCELLPKDIMDQHIIPLLRNNYRDRHIWRNDIQTNFVDNKKILLGETLKLRISRDGSHFAHNAQFESEKRSYKLTNTQTNKTTLFQCPPWSSVKFSRNGTYLLFMFHDFVRPTRSVCLYHLATHKKHELMDKHIRNEITFKISNDDTYILVSGRDENWSRHLALWRLDAIEAPQKIPCTYADHTHDSPFIFHPNNKQIIYCPDDTRILTTPIDQPHFDTTIKENVSTDINTLKISKDNMHILLPWQQLLGSQFLMVMVGPLLEPSCNIENFAIIPHLKKPYQAFIYSSQWYIPHKKLIICTDGDGTQKLIDLNGNVFASHSRSNTYITVFACDDAGDYFASGYADGTIIVWNLSNIDENIRGIKINTGDKPIQSLTFGPQGLLLSQSGMELSPGDKSTYIGSTRLWDSEGNLIRNLGDNTIASKMSKNGRIVITISNTTKKNENTQHQFFTSTGWFIDADKIETKLKTITLPELFQPITSTVSQPEKLLAE